MEGKEGEEKGAVEDIIVANCLGCEGGERKKSTNLRLERGKVSHVLIRRRLVHSPT
jgi:hypothetical protein